ncbi:MarR family winged helix-turn-helix transcriptional regulator [Clostridioides difficile]
MNETQDENLLEQFFKVQSLLHKFHLQSHKSHGFFRGTHRGQGRVLSMLKIKPEITQKELSYLLDMRPQSLGELLSKLENQEFITRTPSEKDRRVMVVRLTSKGMDEINKIEQEEDPTNKIFDILEKEEKSILSDILNKITNELERSIKNDDNLNFDRAPHMGPHSRPHPGQFLGFNGREGFGMGHMGSHQNQHDEPHKTSQEGKEFYNPRMEEFQDFFNREEFFEQMTKQYPGFFEQIVKQHPEFFKNKKFDGQNVSKDEEHSEKDINED